MKALAILKRCLLRDGFEFSEGKLLTKGDVAHLPDVEDAASHFDTPELQRQIVRMREAVESDPGLAIGTAKELVETTCRTILHDRSAPCSDSSTIIELVKAVRRELELLPESVPDGAKAADTIRRLLSNLGTIAQGLGELRNAYGTGHGRTAQSASLSPRHARLAVGAAATLATFLFETHQERN